MKQQYKGIILIIASAFFFSLMSLFVKLSGDLPSIQKSFFRNFVAAIFATVILLRSGKGFSFEKRNLPYLIIRSVFGTLGILCNFYAVDHLLLSDASMLNKMSPFFAILCSMFFLREKTRPYQIGAVLAAFAGALFIIRPTFSNLELCRRSSVCWAVSPPEPPTLPCDFWGSGENGDLRGFLFLRILLPLLSPLYDS